MNNFKTSQRMYRYRKRYILLIIAQPPTSLESQRTCRFMHDPATNLWASASIQFKRLSSEQCGATCVQSNETRSRSRRHHGDVFWRFTCVQATDIVGTLIPYFILARWNVYRVVKQFERDRFQLRESICRIVSPCCLWKYEFIAISK